MPKPRVVASLLTQDQEFQLLQASNAAAAAAKADVELEVVYAKNNAALQAEQIYRFLHGAESSRPAAILVQTVAGDGLPKVAREAARAGVGWILLNRDADYVAGLRTEFPRLPIGIVTTDQVGIGRIQGQQAQRLLPKGGHALYVQGPADTSAARDRLEGFREVAQSIPITIDVVNAEWTEASSERAVRSWLRLLESPQLRVDLVVAQNDAMAIGARKAFAAARPEWLARPFIGCDGLAESGKKLVDAGELAATVVVQPTAGSAVDFIAAHFQARPGAQGRIVIAARPYPAF